MLNLDPAKLLIIAVVAVILLGPDKLPQVARQVGAAWRSFNEFRHRMETEVRSSIPDLPSSADIARLARSPSALLNHLSTMDADPSRRRGHGRAEAARPIDCRRCRRVEHVGRLPTARHPSTSADAGLRISSDRRADRGTRYRAPVLPCPATPRPPNPPDPSLN